MDDGWKDFKNTYLTGLLACTEKKVRETML